MLKSHADAVRCFARKVAWLLALRAVLQGAVIWCFTWGIIVLGTRMSGAQHASWLVWGALAGFVPIALAAGLRGFRSGYQLAALRAGYDHLNRCGGIIMAGANADLSAWHPHLPPPRAPRVRWRNQRTWSMLAIAAVFLGVAFFLPDRVTALATRRPLEIGKLVDELRAEVETLKEEKLLDDKKAEDLQQQLARLKAQSSALDPNKTWEALDHIKEANADVARRAAEDAIHKTATLQEAQTMAGALELAAEQGLPRDLVTQAARDLQAMLKAAKLEEGLANAQLPPELLSQLNGLSPDDLQKLSRALQANKLALGRIVTNLAGLKMIDAKMLLECNQAGQCPNPDALAAFLCQNTNTSLREAAAGYGKGGIDRGRGDAPLTWKEETAEQGARFREEALPPSTHLSDAQLVGVTRSAPDLNTTTDAAVSGGLGNAQAGGGGAHAESVLPRHRQAVRRYFSRTE